VTEGELTQQGSYGGGCVYGVEEVLRAAGSTEVDVVVDAVCAGAHRCDQGGYLGCQVRDPRCDLRSRERHLVSKEVGQSGLVGEGPDRQKSGAGHEVVVVELRGIGMEIVG